ncbi:hypothetical protein [Methylomonas koyamae]|uniref:putative barnase/colicin E5 family endoribonuclease n=1 Tax=Methylomonas koyamae TaxID=702114 RepID=UPI00112D1EAC|nr:hypothetical protein [Methylomonas koyamae]TPQ24943.1 hypothetical protein C2U68_17355 [Methylomonas koyamae]
MPSPEDYLALIQQDGEASLRLSAMNAVDKQPDSEAALRKLAQDYRLPLEAVRLERTQVERRSRLDAIDYGKLAREMPATAELFRDPNVAGVIHDDVDNLGALEKTLQTGKNLGKAAASGYFGFGEGAAGVMQAGADALAGVTGPIADFFGTPDVLGRPLARDMAALRQNQTAWREYLMPKGGGNIESGVYSGVQSLTQNLLTLPLAIAANNPALALNTMAGITGGQSYGKARDKGLDPGQAALFGAADAAVEYGTEMIPVGRLFGDLNAGAPFFKTLANQLATEIPGEQVATAFQDLNEWAVLNPDKTFGDYLAARPDAAIQTLVATAVGTGGTVSVLKGAEALATRGIDQAEQNGGYFNQLGSAASASKTLNRAPDLVEKLVNDALGDDAHNVYIDANAFMQSGVADQVQALLPEVAEQLPQAIASGGEIRIPVGDVVAKLGNTEFFQPLADHMRLADQELSAFDARQLRDNIPAAIRDAADAAFTRAQTEQALAAGADQVKNRVLEQLAATGRFQGNANENYATLVGQYYATQAQRFGMSPETMFERYPVNVDSVIGGGRLLNQANNNDGPFGPILTDYARNASAAIAKLTELQTGEAVGALHHPEIGDIDLVWGEAGTGASDGYGLAKLVKFHPEVVGNLQEIISGMQVVSRSDNRINLESADHKAGVRLTWDNQAKHWLMTAFEKRKKGAAGTRTDTTDATGKDDTASLTSASDAIVDQTLNKFYQDARGAYSPDTNTIALLEKADLSTFLHESGHMFLELHMNMMANLLTEDELVGTTEAQKQLIADTNTLLNWFGLQDVREWFNLDFEQKRAYHEQFAEAFEKYLFEGQAPSLELSRIFATFRAWLKHVYQHITRYFDNAQLNQDVRSVFDRMLATDEQIELAQQGRSLMPLFSEPEQSGMSDQEFAEYQAAWKHAINDAKEQLALKGMRDMQWLQNARNRTLKRLQQQHDDLRRETRAEVRMEVYARPVYQAWQFLTRKLTPEDKLPTDSDAPEISQIGNLLGLQAGRLEFAALSDMDDISEDLVKVLVERKMTAQDGLHPDIVAELFGFSSGDELVKQLAAAIPPKEMIEQLTDHRMLQEHAELSSPQAIQEAAHRALFNEARAKFVTTEANALAKATGGVRLVTSVAKEMAHNMISRVKIRDLSPSVYTRAEARAAKAALQAEKKGDIETAAAEKRNQVLNVEASKAAYEAKDDIESGLKYLKKFDGGGLPTIAADYNDQILAILDRYDFRKMSDAERNRRELSLAEWLAEQENQGLTPNVPPELLREHQRIPYKDLTVEELRGLIDTVKQIAHMGREQKKLLVLSQKRNFLEMETEVTDSIVLNASERVANDRSAQDALGKFKEGVGGFFFSHIRASSIARVLDGGKENGPMWDYFIRPANVRGEWETSKRAEYTQKLSEIMSPVFKGDKLGGKGKFYPSINRSLNKTQVLAMALNMGNESNMQRLLGGEGWTESQIRPVVATLTADDWLTVQKVWDLFEEFRPLIAEKERRLYGKEPNWIPPRPFTAMSVDGPIEMAGGYYPVKYDPRASIGAEQHADAEEARAMLKAAYSAATTRRSFTKNRVDAVLGRPLLLSLDGVFNGLNEVIHDLAWHEWLIDMNKVLGSRRIDGAIRQHYGPDYVRVLKQWEKDIAGGDTATMRGWEKAGAWMRQNISAAGLSFNLMSAAMQFTGITQSFVRVGAPWMTRGILQMMNQPKQTMDFVNERSVFMTNRSRTRFRELSELRNRIQYQSEAKAGFDSAKFWLIMRAQGLVDYPTWIGAFYKALADNHGEEKAAALADQAVIDAQGGGETKDLSAIENDKNPLSRLFTLYYNFMGTLLNLGFVEAQTEKNKGKLAAKMLLLFAVPQVLEHAIRAAITPDGDDWDEVDYAKHAREVLGEMVDRMTGLLVLVREFREPIKYAIGLSDQVRNYEGPTGLRLVGDAGDLATQVRQGEFDAAFRKAFINVIGDVTGLPAAQINKTWTGAEALADDQTDNPAAAVFGYRQ